MQTITNARRLRKNMTDAERHLWRHLRQEQIEGCKFRRQTPIGPYIADFVCLPKMLIVEVDGGQHAENQEADARRTEHLNGLGYTVIRFWNNEVLQQTAAVLETIRRELLAVHSPPSQPSPVGGRGQKPQTNAGLTSDSPPPTGEG